MPMGVFQTSHSRSSGELQCIAAVQLDSAELANKPKHQTANSQKETFSSNVAGDANRPLARCFFPRFVWGLVPMMIRQTDR